MSVDERIGGYPKAGAYRVPASMRAYLHQLEQAIAADRLQTDQSERDTARAIGALRTENDRLAQRVFELEEAAGTASSEPTPPPP